MRKGRNIMRKRIRIAGCFMSLGLICMIGLTSCNSQKKYVKVSSINSDGWTEEWTYNEEGKETTHISYYENGEISYREEIVYNGDVENRYCYQGKDDVTLYQHQEIYYEDGKPVKQISDDGEKNSEWYPQTYIYEYDNNEVTVTTYDKYDEKQMIETYDYYNGEFFWKTSMYIEDGSYEKNSKNEFEFDKNGNVIAYTNVDLENDEKILEKHQYFYDENGNRIKSIVQGSYYEGTIDGDSEEVAYTTTTYYEYQLLSDYLKEHPQE